MSFAAAVESLNALGLELAPRSPRRKFDLAHMRALAAALGDPQTNFPSVLIAGTNGKGSTAATLASILAAAGYRTGLYTSPHLERVTERIRISEPAQSNVGAPGASPLGTRDIAPQITDAVIPSDAEESASPDPRSLFPVPCFTEIPEADFARLYLLVDETGRRLVSEGRLPHPPSYFETLTALAFLYFANAQPDGSFANPVDIAILEVGLGGRLDATNIVDPLLSVITDIALDHQEYLGPTIADIAREKAGILRPGGTLVTLPQHPEANQAIGEIAQEIAAQNALGLHAINAAEYLPGRDFHTSVPGGPFMERSDMSGGVAAGFSLREALPQGDRALALGLRPNHYDLSLSGQTLRVRSPLYGEHQQRNIALAIASAVALRNRDSYEISQISQTRNVSRYNITNSAIEAGISHTSWPGRLEFLPPNLFLDVAHNPAGAWTLRAALASLPQSQPRTLLFSCLRDKDLREMAQILFPLFDSTTGGPQNQVRHHIVLAPVASPRAASLDELVAAARALDISAVPAHSSAEALDLARRLTPPGGLIVATGSIYLVGAVRALVGDIRTGPYRLNLSV
ncbi:MAG TPA: folylpolyglutamate synthase/dihydrofolate synthase family protein [Acidobacteriaceae bacterium]